MTTIWKSDKERKTSANANPSGINQVHNNTITGTTLASWSRQQKVAMVASFTILGVLLVVTACSKQSSKPALASVPHAPATKPETSSALSGNPMIAGLAPATEPTAAKKTQKKRPANVSYSDPNTGFSFLYPRKFSLTSGTNEFQPGNDVDEVPMNFVRPGGTSIATVALPDGSYPGTDFASGVFSVNVNRSVSQKECEHFAFVDINDPDGEPVDAEKVKIGSNDMEMTSSFSASALKQSESQYYHRYENGACYEYVLSLSTGGYGAKDGIEPVNRDEVFAKLEKILSTAKITQSARDQVAEQTAPTGAEGKE